MRSSQLVRHRRLLLFLLLWVLGNLEIDAQLCRNIGDAPELGNQLIRAIATYTDGNGLTEAVSSDPFTVVPAEVSITIDKDVVTAWLEGPEWGYRLIDVEGSSQGANPVRGATLSWILEDGSIEVADGEGTISDGVTTFAAAPPDGATAAEVTDQYGNTGWLSL